MTNAYRWVQWNRHKRVYDAVIAAACVLFLAVFVGLGVALYQPPSEITPPILLIRGLATLAIVLLHIILAIGPLARLDDRFAPLLYNRRHLGVTFFVIAAAHGVLATLFYGGFGVRDPVSATVAGYDSFASISGFPFEVLGLLALLIFFVMAATSHDFWLSVLGHRFWKTLHMLLYVAYGLVLAHVALGSLQSETNPLYAVLLFGGTALIAALHTLAGVREWRRDSSAAATGAWIDAGVIDDIEPGAARVLCPGGQERIAVFRAEDDSVCAVSNVCAHQGGPLGEGRIIDGCITCPWHGYQYRPEDGQSPPPYTEKIPTYEVRLEGRRIFVRADASAPGTLQTPARPRSEGNGA